MITKRTCSQLKQKMGAKRSKSLVILCLFPHHFRSTFSHSFLLNKILHSKYFCFVTKSFIFDFMSSSCSYLPSYLPIYLPTYLSTNLPTYLPIYLPSYISTCNKLSLNIPIATLVFVLTFTADEISTRRSFKSTAFTILIPVNLPIDLSTYLPIYISTYLPI